MTLFKKPVPFGKLDAPMQKRIINFLKWVDANPHFYGGWTPGWVAPEATTHFSLRGDNGRIKVVASTARVGFNFLKVSNQKGRIYELNAAGKRLLARYAE